MRSKRWIVFKILIYQTILMRNQFCGCATWTEEEPNIDLYVTGSNSRMLSMDILTEFKDRGEEIRVNPLTYDEFVSAYQGGSRLAWTEFMMYGVCPL